MFQARLAEARTLRPDVVIANSVLAASALGAEWRGLAVAAKRQGSYSYQIPKAPFS